MPKFENNKDCRILLDWVLSHDFLSAREIHKHLIKMGFDYPSNLASTYSFFVSEYHYYKNNQNFERVLVVLQSMIIDQFMEFYNFYPRFDSSGFFGYSNSSAREFG